MAAVATLLCQRQVVADASIITGECFASIDIGFAVFQRIKALTKTLPLIFMAGFKEALLHFGPSRLRAMPFT